MRLLTNANHITKKLYSNMEQVGIHSHLFLFWLKGLKRLKDITLNKEGGCLMVVTLSWASIVSVAGVIVAIGSAWKVIIEAKKSLNKPYVEVMEKFDHYDKCLAKDKERIDTLEAALRIVGKDNEIELKALRDIINHLRTDNNTGEMKKIEDDIDTYLISRLNNIQL